ncbi:hypothetical protein IAG41_20160 [Sphingomonas sp. JC676]|uniref:hypothetical protein n=1 Tax=Sphingomonas sp. JC676 TaxID=2768065 RepID=UPI001658576A|nr:hypothetical protein [Sphingomonas sp. JC676]MBC9034710.1 hypothetical protein [Sphingomonas sp. JC676]
MVRFGIALATLSAIAFLAAPASAQGWSQPPRPPAGAASNQAVPPLGPDGRYVTLNQGLSQDETSWHVRAALNVAALGCRDAAERATVAAYNRLIARNSVVLAAAASGVKTGYRARYGADWEPMHDRDMTRLYNFFAQPPAQQRFCAVARAVLAEAQTVRPGDFAAFASAALPRLEAPFTDFYRDYDAYRTAYAEWRSGAASSVMAMASVPDSPGAR